MRRNAHPLAYFFGILRNTLWLLIIFTIFYLFSLGTVWGMIIGFVMIIMIIALIPTTTGKWLTYQISNTAYIRYLLEGRKPKKKEKPEETAKKIKNEEVYLVKGNTYPFKEELKKLEAVWIPEEKAWKIKGNRLKLFLLANAEKIKEAKLENNTLKLK
ncbi:MAG: hypothetical protein DSY42_03010 [Aquifex sp.]|nr:MAG: hypothetical protein DSY42_03010 [Aquifex sp.]